MKRENDQKLGKRTFEGFTCIEKQGYYQLRKIGLTGDRVRNDPAFGRTRLLAKDFARAGQLSRHIMAIVKKEMGLTTGTRQLTGVIMKIMQTDQVNPLGYRNLVDGYIDRLEGVELNKNFCWHEWIKVDGAIGTVDGGHSRLTWPAINPATQLLAPQGYTHMRLKAMGLTIDTGHNVTATDCRQTACMPLKNLLVPSVDMDFTTPVDKRCWQVIIVGGLWYACRKNDKGQQWKILPGPVMIKRAYYVQ